MLIEIDSSAVDDATGTGVTALRSRECIENLLLAHHASKHVVWVESLPRDKLNAIENAFSPRARGVLRELEGYKSEIKGWRGRLKSRVKVGVGPSFGWQSVVEQGKDIIHIPLHHFHDLARLTGSVLLGENLNDAAF